MAGIPTTTNSKVIHPPNWVWAACKSVEFVLAVPRSRMQMSKINQSLNCSGSRMSTETSLRAILNFALIMALGACALEPPPCPGTRAYDIQVCRGEKPLRIPNFYMEAIQRSKKCEQCIDIEANCYHGLPPQCRPKWKFE